MHQKEYPILDRINYPSDIKKLTNEELIKLCADLREYIIDIISENPGHFGASLGVVELTVALHYVYNTPIDKLIWDVGHQAYGHKILTGRKDKFNTLRKLNGISGFPNIEESIYDAFTVGHSSTSISAALGMAVAKGLKNESDKNIVAIIGDGSMTAGLAFEGLNNAGMQKSNLLVVLNDNHMAIDPNVGALNEYLLDITTSQTYNKVKEDVWNILGKLKRFGPNTQGFIQKVENGIKSVILKQSNLFESLNFRYFGPIDGHDVIHLTKILHDLQHIPGPKLLHVLTKKGKGYKYAEEKQTEWHSTSYAFNIKTGKLLKPELTVTTGPKFQDVFGITICQLAELNPKVVGITPAMPTGCSLTYMMEKFPDRTFDVGIAEQHAVTFSAGLATEGYIAFCNIYSSFMQRAFDQAIHDVALQKLNVVFCLDRGGLVGSDGATHHGAFDLSFMRMIPNMIVAAPMDELELRNMMYTAQTGKYGPFSIRYPRGNGDIPDWQKPFELLEPGKGRMIKNGQLLAILSIGAIGTEVARAIKQLSRQNINVAHYDMRYVKPLDTIMLNTIFEKFDKIITVEDNVITGGFGSAVLEYMNQQNYHAQVKRLGIPDMFIEHGTQAELYRICGYDYLSIVSEVKKMLINEISLS